MGDENGTINIGELFKLKVLTDTKEDQNSLHIKNF